MPKYGNTLALEADDADVLQEDIENAFGVKLVANDFGTVDAPVLHTAGELHELLVERLGATSAPRRVCLFSVVFYRLREVLARRARLQRFSPKTDLENVLPRTALGPLWKQVGRETGLELRGLAVTRLGGILIVALLFGSPILGLWFGSPALALLGWVLMVAVIRWDPGTLAPDCRTMADLSRLTLAFNFGKLSSEYKVCHPDDVWQALLTIMKWHTQNPDLAEINRDTRFCI